MKSYKAIHEKRGECEVFGHNWNDIPHGLDERTMAEEIEDRHALGIPPDSYLVKFQDGTTETVPATEMKLG